MAMPAVKIEEVVVDQRIARLEAHVEHIQSDVSEIKIDLRRLDTKVDDGLRRLDAKIDGGLQRLDARGDSLKDAIAGLALSTEKGFASLTRWGIGLYVTLLAALATGFMWIIQRLPPVH